jgi:hypothetical protein
VVLRFERVLVNSLLFHVGHQSCKLVIEQTQHAQIVLDLLLANSCHISDMSPLPAYASTVTGSLWLSELPGLPSVQVPVRADTYRNTALEPV